MRGFLAGALTAALLLSAQARAQSPSPPPSGQPPAEQQQPDKPGEAQSNEQQVYEDQVVVTASRREQTLVNAPATVSLITNETLINSGSTSYADVFRAVPGVNVTQTSARDINFTSRGATSTLSTSQLALVDGRSIYLDFFGFIAWDFLPVNPAEIKQIEVIRGPASAIWGANAMNGVVNVITKSPRELQGSSVTIGAGGFGRKTDNSDEGAGALFYVNGSHDFGFQADLTRGPGDAVEGRVRAPVADEEGAGHDRSSWSVPRMLAPARAPGDRAKLYISLSHY